MYDIYFLLKIEKEHVCTVLILVFRYSVHPHQRPPDTLQEINISHLGKRKIIDSKVTFGGDMLVPTRVVTSINFLMSWAMWLCSICLFEGNLPHHLHFWCSQEGIFFHINFIYPSSDLPTWCHDGKGPLQLGLDRSRCDEDEAALGFNNTPKEKPPLGIRGFVGVYNFNPF